ncbi:MAG: ABC transporter permease [Candidatus Omnitrophica bacterium]|nr:ABC transporter permease [Candidatus Omnitrophota bacterium]MBU1047756.1 ABC transporter permease [Candidatus Omnitrophota bacterium]MBU1766966.1 ABC transporter permease [Candidatus Omnitrophota bacterium]MBU1889343.1 ABC transporter permease [Candidatus Omnitrophota bacterium]
MKINILHIIRIVKFGGKNLWLHKLRSLLTMLGIVFGVASVIAMLAIGEGASFEAREKIKELGSNNIIIRSVKPPSEAATQMTSWLDVYGLAPSDFRKISSIPSIENIVPTWEIKEEIWRLAKNTPGRVVGTTPDYAETTNMKVENGGRFINEVDMDTSKSVVVIGYSIKNILFLGVNPIGEKIKIKSNYFTVIGVVKAKVFSKGTGSFEAEDINFDVYLPLSTARAYFGEFDVKMRTRQMSWVKFHRFIAKVKDTNKIMSTSALINQILESTHKNPDYEILVPLELLRQAEHTKRIFSIVLGSIAAISLLVGGIGIMNIMLATVTERTREIGIRRALGAKRRDIIYQFVTEAVILSATGGFIGVVIGVVIPAIVSKFADMVTIITLWSVLLAFLISVAVGLTFGIYPARKAALLDPIEALRYE